MSFILKEKKYEVNRLIIYKDFNENSNITQYIKSWKLKKISNNKYRGFFTVLEVDNKNKKIILDFPVYTQWGSLIDRNSKTFGLIGNFSIKHGMNTIEKKINELDKNCKIERTYTIYTQKSKLLNLIIFYLIPIVLVILIYYVFKKF